MRGKISLLLAGILASTSLGSQAMALSMPTDLQKTSNAYRGIGYRATKGKRQKSLRSRSNRRKAKARK